MRLPLLLGTLTAITALNNVAQSLLSNTVLSATVCSNGHKHALESGVRLRHLKGSHVLAGHMQDGLDVSDHGICTAHGDAGQLLPS